MQGNTLTQEKRETEVVVQMNILEKETLGLESLFDRLRDRIAPILAQANKTCGVDDAPEVAVCSHAHCIRVLSRRIEAINNKLEGLITEIEL